MCGELIGEFRGKITGTRIIELLETGPKIESTDRSTGKLLGIDAEEMATGWSVWRSADTQYGEDIGVITSKSGEMAMYTASFIGTGSAGSLAGNYRGTVYFHSSTPQWTRLNGKSVVFEYGADEEGNNHWRLLEW
ncbi:MAG: hypothetical protein KO206_07125 [Methanomicrobiaceae archaeon]|uniref:Uncharacterized protein n=1 Tax=hydrocarbon metagenome TaxID=938273 RepID=A0A0W8FHN8_9ZZZZ|nr:hypothetical protein [Methanomicrobiaceae archaeon]MDD5418788.1 hypothetical protein [Methanomicrobiaceae archaeon]